MAGEVKHAPAHEAEISARTHETRHWPFVFTRVWPPALLNAPYALTAYKIISSEPQDDEHLAAIGMGYETVLCYVSDGSEEIMATAIVRYEITASDWSISRIEFRELTFGTGAVFGADGRDRLAALLAKDNDSLMSRCDPVPEGVTDTDGYKAKHSVLEAVAAGALKMRGLPWPVEKMIKKLTAIFEIDDAEAVEAEEASSEGDSCSPAFAALLASRI